MSADDLVLDDDESHNSGESADGEDEAVKARKRKERLEQNRISARESRKRKKTMIEELQRTVISLSRENKDLNERNENLRRQLMEMGAKYPTLVPLQAIVGQAAAAAAAVSGATGNSNPTPILPSQTTIPIEGEAGATPGGGAASAGAGMFLQGGGAAMTLEHNSSNINSNDHLPHHAHLRGVSSTTTTNTANPLLSTMNSVTPAPMNATNIIMSNTNASVNNTTSSSPPPPSSSSSSSHWMAASTGAGGVVGGGGNLPHPYPHPQHPYMHNQHPYPPETGGAVGGGGVPLAGQGESSDPHGAAGTIHHATV